MSYQSIINSLGNSIFDLDNIAQYSSNFPDDWDTNPIGSYGVGMQSDARHQAASARASDKFNDMLNFSLIPRPVQGLLSDSLSFAGGVGIEGVGSFKDWIMSGFKDKNYLEAAKQDIISDWKGTFGTPYGTPTKDIMNNVYNSNGYMLNTTPNIFNQGSLNAQNRVPIPQGLTQRTADKVNPTVQPQGPAGGPQPLVQPPVQPTVQPRVNNVSPGGGNSRRGPSYAQQAATVNRKAKSMGVASPIRRSGNKYGFGL
jgi:hypothetical protein